MKKTFTVVFSSCLILLTACSNRPDTPLDITDPEPTALPVVHVVDSAEADNIKVVPMVSEAVPTATPEPTAPVVNVPAPTTAPASTATPHTHEWIAITENVHHDAVTEQVKVVDQAATEGHFEGGAYNVIVCRCGAEFTSGDAWASHSAESGEGHGGWTASVRSNQVWIEGTPEISHMETKVIQDAWDEQVITGYVCGVRGATK